MDRRKIENIIIIILALLNFFLLSVLLADRVQLRRADRETAARVTELLGADGISVGRDAVLVQQAPAQCTVVRDFDEELSRMNALIGSTASEDLGGSIRFYRSDKGQAVLRGTGEISMLLTGECAPVKSTKIKTAENLFKKTGVALSLWSESRTDREHVDCCCLWDGVPVYNAKLGFDFSGDTLTMVNGTMVLSREVQRSREGVMDSVSMLMRFLELVHGEGFLCTRLESLTPGYLMSVTVSGESTLTPVWHIETDTGDLYINAVSGKPETVS